MTIFIQHYDRNGKTIAVIKIQNNDNLMALLLCSFSPVRLFMFTVLFSVVQSCNVCLHFAICVYEFV